MRKQLISAAVIVVGAVALSGCGGGSTPAPDPTDGGAAGPAIDLKVVASNRTQHIFESWEWLADEINNRGDGVLTATISDMTELGLGGAEALDIVADGLADVIDVVPGYVAGEAPVLEGVQLPGFFDGFDDSREAWKAWGDAIREGDWVDGYVFGTYGWECIYLYSSKPITSLSDLGGMRIRTFGAAQTDFVSQLGAEPVSMGLAEVYSAMQTGTIDGVITGSTAGAGLSLPEVATHLVDLNLGCTGGFAVINQGVWDSLSDDQRALMEQIGEDFFDKGWEVARTATDEGIERNTSQGVEFVETAAEWKPRLQEITKTVIVPGWVSRVGPGAQQLLDDVVAPRLSWSLD